MGMFLERRRFANLVVKKLAAYRQDGEPIDSEQLIQDVLELLDNCLQAQMSVLREIRDILTERFPKGG